MLALSCTLLHSLALSFTVLHGIAWYYMVLHGIAWYCMVLAFWQNDFLLRGGGYPSILRRKNSAKNSYFWPKNAKFLDHFMANFFGDFPLRDTPHFQEAFFFCKMTNRVSNLPTIFHRLHSILVLTNRVSNSRRIFHRLHTILGLLNSIDSMRLNRS